MAEKLLVDRDRDVLVAIHAHEIGYIPPPYRCKPEADMPPKSDPTWVEESPPETIPAMRTSGELSGARADELADDAATLKVSD